MTLTSFRYLPADSPRCTCTDVTRSANPGEPESPQSLRPRRPQLSTGVSEKGKVAGGILFRDIGLRHSV